MTTSKFSWFYLFIGMLITMSILYMPVQAESVNSGEQQYNSNFVGKPPTKVKRPKATPKSKTATPKPANTATKMPPTHGVTLAVPSATLKTSATPIGTNIAPGTSLPTSTFSSELNTTVAELTSTSGAIYKTSTSAALTASSTPTKVGAPTSTPNHLELTATSIVKTTVPQSVAGLTGNLTVSPTSTKSNNTVPITSDQPEKAQSKARLFGILGVGFVILFLLVYMLRKELKKSS